MISIASTIQATKLFLKKTPVYRFYIRRKLLWALLGKIYFFIIFIFTPQAWKLQYVVRINGGLGSQMGQYFWGQVLSKRMNVPVIYDISWYEEDGYDNAKKDKRNFMLKKVFPGIELRLANKKIVTIYKNLFFFIPQNSFIYDERTFEKKRRYYAGYYANKKYTENSKLDYKDFFKFKIDLQDKNLEILEKINAAQNSVAVHIRRGDYVNHPVFGCIPEEYFTKAIKYISEKLYHCTFFIFSNDISWCKKIFSGYKNVFFCDNNSNDDGYFDLYLMSKCQHFIISNSSFSAAAACLGSYKDKVVVCPFIFCLDNGKIIYMDDCINNDWIKIEFTPLANYPSSLA